MLHGRRTQWRASDDEIHSNYIFLSAFSSVICHRTANKVIVVRFTFSHYILNTKTIKFSKRRQQPAPKTTIKNQKKQQKYGVRFRYNVNVAAYRPPSRNRI